MLPFGDEGDEAWDSEDTGTSALKRFRVDMTRRMCTLWGEGCVGFAALLSRERELGSTFCACASYVMFIHHHYQHLRLACLIPVLLLDASTRNTPTAYT